MANIPLKNIEYFIKKMEKYMAGTNDLLLYKTEDGENKIEVRLGGETVWLTQAQMAELFQRN
jgi:hypothetical protein